MKITPKQVQDACAQIQCNKENGTGFFISEKTLITARHVIDDYESHPVTVVFKPNEGDEMVSCEGIVLNTDWDLDVAIIELKSDLLPKGFLPATNSPLRFHDRWHTFGFPFSKTADGQRFNGKIMNFNLTNAYDLALSSSDVVPGFDFGGLSGAPMVTDEGVSGIVTWSTVSGLGAVSVRKLYNFLIVNNISVVENPAGNQFPEDFEDELKRVEVNIEVNALIDEKLVQGKAYVLIQGSPGSGKSVIAATYKPSDNSFQVVGRYLIRIPGDNQPVGIKISKESIMLWFEDLIQETIRGEIAPVEDVQFEKRIERLQEWINQLGEHYKSLGISGIIMIDGLDEILNEGYPSATDFLSIFPERLPANVRIIFSCTTGTILTPRLKAQVGDSIVTVSPLAHESCRAYLQREFERYEMDFDWAVVEQIVLKSEGHPLYLRYLLEILKDDFPENINVWLDSLPLIGGDISKYYDVIWDTTVSIDSDRFWTCLTASQLRQPVFMDRFVKMLPEVAKYSFTVKFPKIRHLFKNSQQISLHHSSFSIFIANKSDTDVKTVHDNISKSNLELPKDEYSIVNLIHHFLRSNEQEQSIMHCNQEWADKCAVIHMQPDLIIDDIKEVELLCLNKGYFPRFIDLKLLLSRINFRYDNVLAKHAYDIADALITRKRPADAMKYIVRRDLLLVSFEQALLLLQELFEQGNIVERKRLITILEGKLISNCELAEKQDKVDLGSMAGLMRIRMIGYGLNDKRVIAEGFVGFNNFLSSILENATVENEQNLIIELRDEMFTWYHGYNIYKFNAYSRIEKVNKLLGEPLNGDWIKPLCDINLSYKANLSNQNERSPAYSGLIEDLENIVSEFGCEKGMEELVVSALMDSSKRSEMLDEIVKAIPVKSGKFTLQDPNGVDPDFQSITTHFKRATYKGYVDGKRTFDLLPQLTTGTWETYLGCLVERIGYITGKSYRANADSDEALLASIVAELQSFMKAITFSLEQRVKWDRSYALVEGVFPMVVGALGDLLIRYFPDQLSSFLVYIRGRSTQQFGIYTEGYRQIMFQLISQLLDYSKFVEALECLNILEMHLDEASQNRWERTPDLLRLVKLYSQCKQYDKADLVYQKMLDSSMGPNWYKEDQFFMVGNVIQQCWTPSAGKTFLRDFASYLDFGSGELTFQRYVQQAMNTIPAALASKGELARGIAYIQNLTLPKKEEIYANAHSSTIDVTVPGDGYILGANQLIIGSVVVEMLKALPECDPFITLAVVKTFIQNDDTERYLTDYLEVLNTMLKNLEENSPKEEPAMLQEVINLIVQDKLLPHIHKSISFFHSNLGSESFDDFKAQLLEIGVPTSFFEFPEPRSVEHEYTEEDDEKMKKMGLVIPGMGKMSHRSKTKAFLRKAEEAIINKDRNLAAKEIVECFSLLKEGGTDIWMGKNLGKEHIRLFEILKENFSTNEVIILLADFIANHNTSDWVIANFFIKYFGELLDLPEQQDVLASVAFHVKTIIQDKGKFEVKYDWLTKVKNEEGPNVSLVKFIIWALNYPGNNIQFNGREALLWLANKRPWIISLLHQEAMKDDGLYSSEVSAYVLKELSNMNSGLLASEVVGNKEFAEQIEGQDHFMIKAYYWEILQNVSDFTGKPIEEFPRLFSYENFTGSDVIIEDSTEQTSEIIDDLNHEAVLDRAFCERYYQNVNELCLPLDIVRQKLVDKYIRRSFYAEELYHSTFDYIERCAVNKALTPNVGLLQLHTLKGIMELPILKYGV